MGVAGSAAAGRLDVQAGRMKVPASQRGVIALNSAGDTSTRAVPAVSTERSAMTAPPPCAASSSARDQPNLIRTRGVVRRLHLGKNSKAFEASIGTATGEMVAVSQDTGKIIWDDKLPSSYGAAAVTNDVVSPLAIARGMSWTS